MDMNLSSVVKEITNPHIKVVSFDIFDTLLLRPALSPIDIFRLVGRKCGYSEQEFVNMRTTAERKARRHRFNGNEDVTFEEIYKKLGRICKLDNQEIERLKKTEIDVEEEFLYARDSVKMVFEAAKKAGKKIIIVSDMYFPKTVLEKFLKKNGYIGYEKVYVSCEYMKTKESGNLFKLVLSDFSKIGINANEFIHIGDSLKSDIEMAKKYGMQAVYFPRTSSLFNSNQYFSEKRWESTIDKTFLMGALANSIFDNPFEKHNENYKLPSSLEMLINDLLSGNMKRLEEKVSVDFFSENVVDLLKKIYENGHSQVHSGQQAFVHIKNDFMRVAIVKEKANILKAYFIKLVKKN